MRKMNKKANLRFITNVYLISQLRIIISHVERMKSLII